MSIDDCFKEQSYENNTMEEPSVVEEPTIFEDAVEASTIATDLVKDEQQIQLLQVQIFAHKVRL